MQDYIEEIIEISQELQLRDANEAETRKKIIDKVLENVLGWDDSDISYEEKVQEDGSTTFADYIIRNANISIIVEAKKVGFLLAETRKKKRRVLIGADFLNDVGREAIIQVRDYCRKKSIQFAILTNGLQWIVFPAVRTDGIIFEKSNAIFFESLEQALIEEFEYFHNLLSREGVISGNLMSELIGRDTDQINERRLNQYYHSSRVKSQNPIYPFMENAISLSFSDSLSETNPELLEKCYVNSPDKQKFDHKIKMHLNRKENLFSVQPKRPMREKDANSLKKSIQEVTKNSRPLAILILGSVGAGKTTFLEYSRKITTIDFFNHQINGFNPLWIQLDFRDFSPNESPIQFIYLNLFKYINENDLGNYEEILKFAYAPKIEELKKGPMFLLSEDKFNEKVSELILDDYKVKTPYVDKILSFYAEKSPVFIVIDNVDQFEEDTIQSSIFTDSIALSRRLGLNLIMAMRESTFVLHKDSPTFNAFDFDSMLIEPPEVSSVIAKRFFLAEKLSKNIPAEFIATNGIRMKINDISEFIGIIKSSVLGTEIGTRIEVLSNNDIRLGLRMTREFLASGYSDPGKAMQKYQDNGKYRLPVQEAFRSILLGNQLV